VVIGKPTATVICHCDDCQAGGELLEGLPVARPVRDAFGGTTYVLVRKDCVVCTRGEDRLKPYKLRDRSITNRVVTECCSTAMLVSFDRGPHWVSIYRSAYADDAPAARSRVQVKFAPSDVRLPGDVPEHQSYPLGLMGRLAVERVWMTIGGGRTGRKTH
jgi:hypothetical protein